MRTFFAKCHGHRHPESRAVGVSSDKIKKELKDLLKDPVNRYCADCPIKGPTWASVNLGVWICMPCSGIHRSLGTHITQVRSVDLDKWKPEWVEVMRTWGNAKANAVWEAKMPKGYEGKPSETEAQELTPKMQKFIRDKYEKKKWYSESAAKKMSKEESESEEEEDDASEKEEEPKKKPSAKPTTAAASTAKKPLIVMSAPKSSTTSAPVKTAAKPAPVVDNLLDTFDPFGDSSFEPSFPAATSASSSQFLSAPSAPAPASVSKPGLDLSSLYGMAAPATAATTPSAMMGGWGQAPQQPAFSQFPGTMSAQPAGQPSFAANQPPFGAQPGAPQQQFFISAPQQSPMYPGGFPQMSPTIQAYPPMQGQMPMQPQQQQQQQQFGGFGQNFPPQPSPSWPQPQSSPAWPQQQPPVGPPKQAPPSNDPFAGLF